MNASINTQVTIALNAAGAYQGAVAKLRVTLKGQLTPQVRDALLPAVAAYYKVNVLTKTRGEGCTIAAYTRIVEGVRVRCEEGDKGAHREAGFEAAKTAMRRLVADIVGKTMAQAPEIVLNREQMRLIKACHAAGITMKMYGQGVAQLTK